MKKTFLTLVGIMLCCTMFAQQEDLKKHNFGLTFNFGSYPMGNSYFSVLTNTGNTLKSAVAFDIAFKYEYMLNKKNTFSLTAEPGYTNHLLTTTYPLSDWNYTTTKHSVNMINLPILVNYRLPITNKVNFLAAAGANASFYLTKEKELHHIETPLPEYNTAISQTEYLSFENPLTLDFALKAGIEIKAKHRFQLNVSYFLPLLGNTNYKYVNSAIDYDFSNSFDEGINRLMFGVSVFF